MVRSLAPEVATVPRNGRIRMYVIRSAANQIRARKILGAGAVESDQAPRISTGAWLRASSAVSGPCVWQ